MNRAGAVVRGVQGEAEEIRLLQRDAAIEARGRAVAREREAGELIRVSWKTPEAFSARVVPLAASVTPLGTLSKKIVADSCGSTSVRTDAATGRKDGHR